MKKLGLVLLMCITSSIASASCGNSYRKAATPFLTKNLGGSYVEPDDYTPYYVSLGTSAAVDAVGILMMSTTFPAFTASGVVMYSSVSLDEWLRGDMRTVGKIISQARVGSYSSDMDELHQFTEDFTGRNISKNQLFDTIVKLDDDNAFCTDGIQDMEDFKYNIASSLL